MLADMGGHARACSRRRPYGKIDMVDCCAVSAHSWGVESHKVRCARCGGGVPVEMGRLACLKISVEMWIIKFK